MKTRQVLPIISITVIILLLLWVNNEYLNFSPVDIQQWIQSFGFWGPIFFILVYTVRPLILFPASVLSIAGGLAFGAVNGFVYIMIGATLSAMTAYLLARKFNRAFIQRMQEGRVKTVIEKMEERGFMYVLVLRLAPLLNFDLVSYSAGLANVKIRAFLFATIIGILPGTIGYSFLGASVAEGDMRVILLGLVFFAIVISVPIIFRKRVAEWLGLQKNEKE
ncbi:TVP38/TMEM64 family protein [Jeotgalibacillus aurantiacus]|uniref:TVP38/TMEM64 family protein n=1 Tax=Jeotgalibacillus aurantiacus TaxID=2763266 RepID=UPI001D0A8C0F|nr:TVP38/TMEM64 family protein [Jeotgalibacillus aurantiacus]